MASPISIAFSRAARSALSSSAGEGRADELPEEGRDSGEVAPTESPAEPLRELLAPLVERLAVADARRPADRVGDDAEGRPGEKRVGRAAEDLHALAPVADLLEELAAQAATCPSPRRR